jgi:hypothetical protein
MPAHNGDLEALLQRHEDDEHVHYSHRAPWREWLAADNALSAAATAFSPEGGARAMLHHPGLHPFHTV